MIEQIRRTTSMLRRSLRAADVVGLAGPPTLQDRGQRAGVVLDVQPVAHVGAVAIDRQRLALQRLQDDQRNELFREVVGPVVVGAVR